MTELAVAESTELKYLEKIMKSRRSHYPKHFTGEKIADQTVLKLLEYANTAPNHKNTKPWKFLVFKEKSLSDLIDFLKESYLKITPIEEVSDKKIEAFQIRKNRTSHILAIVSKHDHLDRLPEIEEFAAVSCAVQNIYLSLNTLGVGGYWSTGKITYTKELKSYLKLAKDETIMGFFYLGIVGQTLPDSNREIDSDMIKWV